MKKKCSKCKKVKSPKKFYKDLSKKDGLSSQCAKCRIKAVRKYCVSDKGKLYIRKSNLKRAFGLTLEQYDYMFEKQNGVCAVCGGISKNGRRLAVDHNHDTNKIRGLLCSGCNLRISALEHKTWRPLAERYLRDNRG